MPTERQIEIAAHSMFIDEWAGSTIQTRGAPAWDDEHEHAYWTHKAAVALAAVERSGRDP
jgi:hypothetical protein